MLRFQDKQLHLMLLLILVASGIFFFFFCRSQLPSLEGGQYISSMDNFSDGWLLQTEKESEVVFFPAEYDVTKEDSLLFYHRTPDMTNESLYLVFQTDCQAVQVKIDDMIIYESTKENDFISAYHTVKILPEYHNRNIILKYTNKTNKKMSAPALLIGTKKQLIGQLVLNNLIYILWSFLLSTFCLLMLIPFGFIKNTRFAKGTLLYGCLEGIVFSVLLFLQGDLLPVITGWNYGICFLRVCMTVLLGMVHLMVMQSIVSTKTLHTKLGMGYIGYLIYYICITVLIFFQLVKPDTMETVCNTLFFVILLIYEYVFANYLHHNNKKDVKFILYMNGVLLIGIITQMIMMVVGREISYNQMVLPVCYTFYDIVLVCFGLKRGLIKEIEIKENDINEEHVKAKVINQLNPNLLFASFHSLQTLIKSGSHNSIKMIYYISVYFHSNLKALEKQGEPIPFREELDHILAYLQLQKTRNSKLNYGVECKMKDFQIPRNTIEPLVENAVKHGIAGKDNCGNVVLRTYMRADGYAIQIIDDGVGFDKKNLKNNSNTCVLHLIALLEETCKAQTEIISQENKGTVITIVLPMIDNELLGNTKDEEMISF
ncbi:MAG: histidine kinase [Lachnospiraceae bacterium]